MLTLFMNDIPSLADALTLECIRLQSLGLSDDYIEFNMDRLRATQATTSKPTAVPGAGDPVRVYDVEADIEWAYQDVSSHREPEDMRWCVITTRASSSNHVFRYHRDQHLKNELLST